MSQVLTSSSDVQDEIISYISQQLFSIVNYLNLNGFMHRNLNPDVMLVNEKTYFICLFDLS